MVITIDGPSGVGKSTVARAVANILSISYLDTGAMYRAATLAVIREGVDVTIETELLDVLARHTIGYAEIGITLDGEPVASDVRSEEVTDEVSAVSAHAGVRSQLVEMQRRWVADQDGDAVVEGRDIGTVVFPDARVKIYLSATPLVRAQRRAGDAEASGKTVAEIAAQISARDHTDSTRMASPLRAAEDAVVIDTSELSIDEVVDEILQYVSADV
ncbi:MAG: (d)CMP kinase [Actinomycetota bacterium]|nr:(d)CMP kinase [Actinomycetota bacterium]